MNKTIIIVLLLIVNSLQAIAIELSFENPTLETGTAKRVGAVYRFSDVTRGVDALVKIVSFNNGASLANIDETSGGLYDAFQPTLLTGRNSDSSIDFEITFVNSGTTTEKTVSLNATGADIDGDSRYVKEYILLSKPKSYSLENNTRLEVTNNSDGIYVLPTTTANVSGITVSETRNIITASYENVSKITYTIGAKNGYGTQRWNSLYFKDVSFSNPDVVSVSLPSIKFENSTEKSCKSSFPSVLSSIKDKIDTTGSVIINSSDKLITKVLNASGGTRCNNLPCEKSNTLADKLDFDVLLGNQSDGVLASAWNRRDITITANKEYQKINMGWMSILNINGDGTIKVHGQFLLGGSSSLNINGNVTIYADDFHMNNNSKLNINGSLTIIANKGYFYSSSDISSNQESFVVLTKENLELNRGMKAKGLFYCDGIVRVYSGSRISGAITGGEIIVNDNVIFNYDDSAVNDYCGGSEPEPEPEEIEPIGCNFTALLSKETKDLFDLDLIKKEEIPQSNVFTDGTKVNAMGYNLVDGYVWGYDEGSEDGTLVKIGKGTDGKYQSLKFKVDDLNGSIIVGDIDKHGNMYFLKRENINAGLTDEHDYLYIIDLNNSSENYLKVVKKEELRDMNRGDKNVGKGLDIVDWAFHPKNGKLYGLSRYDKWLDEEKGGNRLYEIDLIDPNSYKVKTTVIKGADDTNDTSYEAFFDENGYFYAYGNKTGKTYRIDMTNPDNIANEAILFTDVPTETKGGDTARCSAAPMGDKPIVSLKSGSSVAEGDSGTTSIVFKMEADRVLNPTFKVNYKVIGGLAKDDDFVKTSGSVECIITTDTHVANCILPIVKGDIIKEPDEKFNISFTSDSVVFINGENNTTGTIINDDSNSFVAYDINDNRAIIKDRKIKTKIVGKDFNLTLARLDSTGALTDIGDENNTKVRVIDIDSGLCSSFDGDMSGFEDINMNGVSTRNFSFNISHVIRKAKVQFFWTDDKDVNQTICSVDSFAIRPDKYALSISPSNIKSGEDFNLTIEAKDAKGVTISNYEEPFSVYQLQKSELKSIDGCVIGDLNTTSQTNFIDGKSIMTLNYKDVGKIQFVVSEVNTSTTEYAHVDASDGSLDSRFITKGTITHKITPAKIDAIFSFKTKNNKNYTYYSADPEKMGSIIDANITMLNKENNPVSNFSSSCWADDVSLVIDYNQLDGLVAIPEFKDANGTSMSPNTLTFGKLNYTMAKDRFTSGKANREILMNFGRIVDDAKAPIKIKLSSPKASLNSLEKNVTKSKTIDFIYARAHAPKIQTILDKNMTAVVNYEVYLPKSVDKTKYGFAGLKQSEDLGDWYVLPDDNAFGFDAPYARFMGVNVKSYTKKGISLKASKAPHSNRIFFTPKEYFIYNQFNEHSKVDSFQVTFYSKENSWTGKGKQGIILDDKASKLGLRKMDW